MRRLAFTSASLLMFVTLAGCGAKLQDGAPSSSDAGAPDAAEASRPDDPPPPPPPPPDRPDGGPLPPPTTSAQPPPRPSTASSGTTRWFAVRRMQLGVTDRVTGKPSPQAWKAYGYDLDARTTSATDSPMSLDSCKRRSGSPTKVLLDGNDGIDNNWGQHVMAVLKSLKADVEEAGSQAITDGQSTLLLRLDNVGADDNGSVPGALYLTGSLGKLPTFTEADQWPIAPASLVDGKSIASPKYAFPNGYMSKGIWVSGSFGTGSASVPVPFIGAPIAVPLDSAVISFRVADGSMGTIAGATNTFALKDAMTPSLKVMGICPGNATFDQVVETMTQSADLVSGAPWLQDVTKECNAISMGLGFLAAPTGVPTLVAAPPPPPKDDCL